MVKVIQKGFSLIKAAVIKHSIKHSDSYNEHGVNYKLLTNQYLQYLTNTLQA